jgi:hypothetical protein
VVAALQHLERITRPVKVSAIDTKVIDEYVEARSRKSGQKPVSRISAATVNRELQHLRAVLAVAHE